MLIQMPGRGTFIIERLMLGVGEAGEHGPVLCGDVAGEHGPVLCGDGAGGHGPIIFHHNIRQE